ncbi:MAG: ABC transporter permease [Acidimicrobiia bacterium]|nr:ABC transporter permease [Acidimicrobiia bacterium]
MAETLPSITGTTAAIAPVGVAEPTRRRRLPSLGVGFGVLWLATLVILTVFAGNLPFVRLPTQAVNGASNYALGPSSDFWFGSDRLGRDVFARCVYGARISLIIAVSSIVVGLLVGTALGMICGYFRGWIDRFISVFVDALLAFPAIIFAALLVGRAKALRQSEIEVLGFGFGWFNNTWAISAVFSLLAIAPITRIVRAQTLSLSQREYVLAARSLGARTPRVLLREILPNVVPALVSVMFTGVAILLAAEAGLAFLGYSVEPPKASWGLMVTENREFIEEAWWATLFPCVMLFLTVLSFNLIGDRVARRFDVREAAL